MSTPAHFEAALEAALSHLLPQPLGVGRNRYAIGFSGGGDSTALLYGLRRYANSAHVFIVDHGLRAGSAEEAQAAQKRAEGWGFQTEILTWQTAPINSALQAKARCARYGLIGVAMRARGLDKLITGHTEDDQAETCLMRYERKTDWRGAAGMTPCVYAPVWPELAGITVLRPLLGQSRESLRAYNHDCALDWSEDPSNDNRDFARIRARDYLKTRPHQRQLLLETAADMQESRRAEHQLLSKLFAEYIKLSAQGFARLNHVPPCEALRHLIHIIGGQGHMIDTAALRRLRAQMQDKDFKAATLGGVQMIRGVDEILCVRDPVIIKGRRGQKAAMTARPVGPGGQIWDGRFAISYHGKSPLMIAPAYGKMKLLGARVKSVPPAARKTLPVVMSESGEIISCGPYSDDKLNVRWLGHERLALTLKAFS